jgi:hypothetical protein
VSSARVQTVRLEEAHEDGQERQPHARKVEWRLGDIYLERLEDVRRVDRQLRNRL